MFELAQYGLPAILIPYPHASADHQTANARWMAEAGAADDPARRRAHARSGCARRSRDLLGDPERLAAMAAASRRLARPDAAEAVAREVLAAAREAAGLGGDCAGLDLRAARTLLQARR